MNWYEWETLQDFNAWHNVIKTKLNYPLASYNQLTGKLNTTAQLTTEYTSVIMVEGKWVGIVEDEHAEGLTATDLRPIKVKE
jgi:hypothetical protein